MSPMKKIFLLALVFSLLTGGLLFGYLRALKEGEAVAYDTVAVAAVDIPALTALTPEMVSLVQLPSGAAHPAAARSAQVVVGLVTDSAIVSGEQLLPAKLKTIGSREDGLAYAIEAGYRALTIPVAEDTGVGFYLKVGDYVDVLSAMGDPVPDEASRERTAAYVVAEDLRILALGAAVTAEGSLPQSVTLMVTPEQAMRFVLTTDRFRLVLRAVGDHSDFDPDYQWNSALLPTGAWRSVSDHEQP